MIKFLWILLPRIGPNHPLSDRRWQRASAEADDVVKPVTHKLNRIAPARCSALVRPVVVSQAHREYISRTLHKAAQCTSRLPKPCLHRHEGSGTPCCRCETE